MLPSACNIAGNLYCPRKALQAFAKLCKKNLVIYVVPKFGEAVDSRMISSVGRITLVCFSSGF